MTELGQVYKCEICGNIVIVTHSGGGELVCCGQPMKLQKENTLAEEGNEKHVPIVEKTDTGHKVKVGSVEHPMDEDHYIEWIEIIAGSTMQIKHLKAGDKPEAEFCTSAEEVIAKCYCNKHGLWRS